MSAKAKQKNVRRKNPDAIKNLMSRFKDAGKIEIAVGFPKGKANAYPDGKSVIDVAAQHVYGVGVPQRDFMSLAQSGIHRTTKPFMKELAKAQTTGEAQTAAALAEAAGQAGQEEIRQAIIALDTPPNAPATEEAKGSSNPLIDTEHMKNSVTYVVRERGGK